MKKAVFLTIAFVLFGHMGLQAQSQSERVLIVYFSRSGNTRAVAQFIHQAVGGDLFELRTAHAYPAEHRAATQLARQERDTNARPELASNVQNIEQYDIIFLGFPNWWGTMPMVFFTFLESHNLTGKTIIPFSTYGTSSGLVRGVPDIQRVSPGVTILEGLSIRGGNARNSRNEVNAWLRRIGMLR